MNSSSAKKRPGQVMNLTTFDSMLGAPDEQELTIIDLPLNELHSFRGFPLTVEMDNDTAALLESIVNHGLDEPIRVRSRQESGYEIVLGHKRVYVFRLLERSTIPAIIEEMDRRSQ